MASRCARRGEGWSEEGSVETCVLCATRHGRHLDVQTQADVGALRGALEWSACMRLSLMRI